MKDYTWRDYVGTLGFCFVLVFAVLAIVQSF
jgi:hypothetical protein